MKKSLIALALAFSAVCGLAVHQPVYATDSNTTFASAASQMQSGVNRSGGSGNSTNLNTFIERIINAVLFLLGAIAVLMIIIGGFRYVMSNGDPSAAKSAKDTILYAVIGLIVAIIAYAVVRWVITNIGNAR